MSRKSKRRIQKSLSITLLLIILQSTFLPYYSYALTTGPHQPEYTSYEESGATDLVNLVTGDFAFSLPILEVPGPEGGFSVPLTYNAGIGTDQEGSWVGLGWTLNVGAITRQYTGFPDDAAGETQSIAVKDLTGVRGWTSNLCGLGNIGWNSQVGHYGQISLLGLSWDESGMSVNPVQLGLTVLSIVSMTEALQVLSAAAEETAITETVAASMAKAQGQIIREAIGQGLSMASNIVAGSQTPVAPSSGYWKYSRDTDQRFLHKNYWYWLDKTRHEDMYGAMYLHAADTEPYTNSDDYVNLDLKVNNAATTLEQFSNKDDQGSASDINYYIEEGQPFANEKSPSSLALDDYSVKAPGVSGSIQPYRFEIGSVSMPRQMSSDHQRFAPVKYQDYKVPFIYKGAPSNNYYHHVGAASSITSPSFYNDGLTATQSNGTPGNNTLQTYNFDDIIFGNANRVRSDVNIKREISQGNHVAWHSNQEIETTTGGFTSGFMDYFTGAERISFRQNAQVGTKVSHSSSSNFTNGSIRLNSLELLPYTIGSTVNLNLTIYDKDASGARIEGTQTPLNTTAQVTGKFPLRMDVSTTNFLSTVQGKWVDIEVSRPEPYKPAKAIGGYSITGADGMTYHFSIPVYDYNSKTYIKDKDDPNKNTTIKRNGAFANTWLLTAITGADFVDRSSTGTANGIVDEYDWGHWVKFNYGLYSSDYKWRIPYGGSPLNAYTIDAENTSKSYSEGNKHTYYLNSIETRSHTALFFKDIRNDNQDAEGKKSLKLTEINLLTNETYKKLISDYGFPSVSGVLNKTLTSGDISTTTDRQNFLYKNTLKRIKFNHSYSLAQGTLNSLNSGGKLTLDRVSIVGKNDLKVMPDYIFTYGNNFNYGVNKWDGWGMYTSGGDATHSTHKASETDIYGAAWSLNKIVTPSGSEILVDYERDTYSSVAGLSVDMAHEFEYDYSQGLASGVNYVKMKASNCDLKVGDQVRVTGTLTYTSTYLNPDCGGTINFDQVRTISAVIDNKITLNSSFVTKNSACNSKIEGTVQPQSPSRKGGNIRVKMLTTKDGTIQHKTRYLYTIDETPTGLTSGVVSQEPDFINNDLKTQPDDVKAPGFPMTPVMYKKVSVLSGNLSTDADYHTKEVYEFETPHQSMLGVSLSNPDTKTEIANNTVTVGPVNLHYRDLLTRVHNKITDRTSKIGSLLSIKVYDKANVQQASTQMTYTSDISNPLYLGVYSEGTLMTDRVGGEEGEYTRIHKMSRTTILKYPNVLKSVVTTKDGFTSKTENLKWDLLSTQVLEKLGTSPGGLITKSVTIPAYTKYPELGSKVDNAANKNMLTQEAAQYVYRADALGNTTGLIAASTTTWKKTWDNYRTYNASTGFYESTTEGPDVWRKSGSYVWKGDITRLKSDGTQTFSSADEYNFIAGANTGWQYLGETKRYGHYSHPLESKNFNNIYSTTKYGYDNRMMIAQASNAEYEEIAFSGAEDYQSTSPTFFGGEVGVGMGVILRKSKGEVTDVHTGDAVVKVTPTTKSFIYKSKGIKGNKFYKSSVWTNSANGRIYLKINGVDQPLSQAPQNIVGSWYRLNYEFKTPASVTSLEIGVTSVNGDVQFDDFRFQPSEAAMTCYVFDPLDFYFAPTATTLTRFEYVLDNDNLFTKYEYNELGQLTKTYIESIKFQGVKLVSESKVDYRRFHFNQ